MNIQDAGPVGDEGGPDPKAVAFESWLYAGDNQNRALGYIDRHTPLTPSHVAIHPTPRYNRRTKRLSVWTFEVNSEGEKVVGPDGAKRIGHTIKVLVPPPWVQ